MEEVITAPGAAKAARQATTRHIKKVAVLGSGVMGSRIACHFANIGLQVVLLDIVPRDLAPAEQAKGLSLQHPQVRNRIVNDALQFAVKSNPSPLYLKDFAARITTGNFDDHLHLIKDCDWVIEAVVERLDIKRSLFERVEQHRKPGTLITSNTSGIPIGLLAEGRSPDFKSNFCGTHFFNPPRYLKLLEVIPSEHTNPEVVNFFMHYGDLFLGKTTVLCKDTPAFIANRIGVFSIMAIFHVMQEMGLTVEEVDALTGPLTGRPSSATFRTCDVVGIDTLVKVAQGVYDNCPDDESRSLFGIPGYVQKLTENGWYGDKSGQGFYKKVKGEGGKSEIMALNLQTFEYQPSAKPRFASIGAAKPIDDLKKRLQTLHAHGDKGSEFLNKVGYLLFRYVSHRIPEITNSVSTLDDAVRAGFGWELGPFEYWDVLGVEKTVKAMEAAGIPPAQWVYEMFQNGNNTFYRSEAGKRLAYNPATQQYEPISGADAYIKLDNYRNQKPVWKNTDATLHDIGDGVLCLEFHTKMNAIGSGILQGINTAIDIAERDGWKGLVIGNDSTQAFSAGANLAMILMLAIEQEYDELDFAIRAFQQTTGRIRYSSIPVVAAPKGLTLGGGCEVCMHADKVVCGAETYIGLVEVGAGVIPAGGGTKEFALRASDAYFEGDVQIPTLQKYLMNIATAKVATSANEAFEMGVFRKGKDVMVVNSDRVIAEAKKVVLELHEEGYTQPVPRTDVWALGRSALGTFYSGISAMRFGGYISEHDELIAKKVAYVICGGDLSAPTQVSEQYFLDLERQAFLELMTQRKSLERVQSILNTGKPLRN
ncbi:3-hydroxyacyl-CoA dehydrogenase [Sphingobacteriales bacterium UPWRP_1]|nr:3-hydroxyacyl-CoA dehydrogenase [Sphingobacteriales bacterium TSM_CSS]PSJ75489.1 3-hydroxyacyl-CoA dehydrogenase [Sphingobacteriales bacterium UPWRP_1]